jgi:aminoglycoside phosphotransferase family enzyme/predicted kinase
MPADLPVAAVETHISTLFFVGDRVYKLKKPVSFPFVDQDSREARQRLCHREVELNRRLAPDVYLGVADILGPDGQLCDHLVVMQRLPEHRRLSTLVRAHDPDVLDHLDRLADVLADFHRTAERSSAIAAAASPDAVAGRWDDLVDEVRPFADQIVPAAELEQVQQLAVWFIQGRHPLFAHRRHDGMICDGHGDLQADDVFCLPDGPRVLDCVEFRDEFRHVDVADDVAFLVMDLERLGASALGAHFVVAYERASGRQLPTSLVDFYVAYRAMVRCAVACMRATQESGPDADASATKARSLLRLCHQRLETAVPRLLVVGGLPGTGKTTLANGLTDETGWALVRSDVVRKELAGLPTTASAAERYGEGLYRSSMTEAVYEELASRARELLGLGRSVVLDASFTAERHRRLVRSVADETRSDLVEVRCVVDPVVADRRMLARAAAGRDASDADPAVARALAAQADPWPEANELDTSGTIPELLGRLEAVVRTRSARGRS